MRTLPLLVLAVVALASLLPPLGAAQSVARIHMPVAARNVVGLADTSSGSATATATAAPGATRTATPGATATPTSTAARIDVTRLPRGDQKQSTTTPQVGYIYLCTAETYTAPTTTFPWVDYSANTWNMNTKVTVDGSVSWTSSFSTSTSGTTRTVTSNGLPSHTSGTFPIASSDDASQYDRNPGSIASQSHNYSLTKSPTVNASPGCLSTGPIGIMLTGPVLFNATDAGAADAPAKEIQDTCGGHPAGTMYHYHLLSPCASDTTSGHSSLMGYIVDGFGIYGHRGESGETLINADLDVCHGHTHTITWDGASTSMYHYHATYEYPYTVGCYRGTAATTTPGGGGGGGGNPPSKPSAAGSWRGR